MVLVLRLLLAAAAGLAAGVALAAAAAAGPAVDSLIVKFRDGIVVDQSAGLPASQHTALAAALQAQYSHVGYAANGALKLQLLNPLALDAARAAVNRVRMLPQVLYASVVPPPSAVVATAAVPAATPQQRPVRRLIVKFRDAGTSAAANRNVALPAAHLNRLSSMAGQSVAHERAMSGGAYVVRLAQALPSDQVRALAAHLATDPSIEYVEPDLLLQPYLAPNDPSYPSQWHYLSPPAEMGGANLPPAWDITTGASSIVVGVIDTGILPAHPDLAGRIVGGYDFISDPDFANDGDGRDADGSDPGDWITAAESGAGPLAGCTIRNSSFHGTHVAGTIGAATGNATGVAGVNWASKILPVRVLGKCGGSVSDIADAIRWSAGGSVPGVPANGNPARVLNLSLGGAGDCPSTLQSAIDSAIAAGAVVVVAAGNSSADASGSNPGNCNGVITVGATGRAGQQASYTNYGPTLAFSAPGGSDGASVLSTINDSATSPDLGSYTYSYLQGTSMATPHVAGIASLMLSVDPTLTPAQVLAKMQASARAFPTGTIRDCTTALCGAGIVDAAAAVLAAVPRSATTTTLASSVNPAAPGTNVTFAATVSGAAPTGTVNFRDGSATIGGCGAAPLAGTDNTKTATCSTSTLVGGIRSITAVYSGDITNAPSTSAVLSQVITGAGPGNVIANGVPVTGLAGSAGAELRYTMDVPAGVTNLRFAIAGGSGDADLYVRFGTAPTSSSYDCRPYASGNNETCAFATAQVGTYHVMVRGYSTFSGVTLTGSYTTPGVNVPPSANFTFTTSGLTANFTDTSTDSNGTIASRAWTFGDTTTSTATNPSKTYAAAGTYSVTLTVTDNGGATNSVTKPVTVTAPPPNVAPTANFTFTTSGLTANFTDTSTDSNGTIASRSWAFGDGATSTATNPSRTYAAAGTYSVMLTVTDNAGATANVTKSVAVFAVAPLPSTLANNVPVTGLSGSAATELRYTMDVPAGATNLRFAIAGGSGDADLYVRFGTAPTTSSYDCRPYAAGNNEACTIAPAQAGTYHVMVRGYSTFSGVSLTGSYALPGANVAPTANFTFTTSGLTATFTDTSTDSDGTIASRSWTFGDGGTSTLTNPSRTYAAAGTYSVMLTVTDNAGATNSVTKSVTVTAPPPNVAPTANFTFTTSGLTASFTDTSTDSDGTIASRGWAFGDGAASTATNPSRTYAAAGTYSVMLTVTDNAGATANVTKAVTVSASPPPSNVLANGVPVSGLSGSAGTELRYTMNVPAGATNLAFTIAGGTGDADLYVRLGAAPTTSSYDCRPFMAGNNETCTISPAQAGTFYVMVRGYTSFSGVTLTGKY